VECVGKPVNERLLSPVSWSLPEWMGQFLAPLPSHFATDEERMGVAVSCARRNILGGGGPFGAALFGEESGELLAPGVNLVLSTGLSILHAEIVALTMAQQVLGMRNLAEAIRGGVALYTSCEPCAQCHGALLWAGISRLCIAGRREDAEMVGFNEGPKSPWPQWGEELEERGIRISRDVCREEARAVLDAYRAQGGVVY